MNILIYNQWEYCKDKSKNELESNGITDLEYWRKNGKCQHRSNSK